MLSINPKECLQEEDIEVKITNLKPSQEVTISSHIKNYKLQDFFSLAYYKADLNGNINLKEDESLGGNYRGKFPMGLIASLKPAPHENKFLRLFKKNIEEPNKIEIQLHNGFLNPEDLFVTDVKPLSSVMHFRHFMGPGVKRIVIRKGRVRGSLFIPAGDGPFPGMIDMFGTAGGLIETRAAEFASNGIVALSLAFFDYEDLPTVIETYDISYFQEAAKILLEYECVKKPHIGVLGVSKGGDLALNMAVHIPEINAAISINGSIYNVGNPLKINDHVTIPSANVDQSKVKIMKASDEPTSALSKMLFFLFCGILLPTLRILLKNLKSIFAHFSNMFYSGKPPQNNETKTTISRSKNDISSHPLIHLFSSLVQFIDGAVVTRDALLFNENDESAQKALIPLHKTKAHILFLVGEDDHSMHSLKFAQDGAKWMEENGKTNYEIKSYSKTGHLLGPPYTAYCPASFHKFLGMPVLWGGSLEEHTAAQLDAWKQCLRFFKEHL